MNPLFITSAAAAAFLQPSAAFLSLPPVPFNEATKPNPSLADYAQAQENVRLEIRLDVRQAVARSGSPGATGSRIGIDGMVVELHGNENARRGRPRLPGCDGPNPHISSGPKAVELIEEGGFVDLTGSRKVHMGNGAWEMVWRNNADKGALICGFDVPQEVKRNGASIPEGRLYMTFPVWASESLRDLRARREKAEERAADAVDRLREASLKMEEESNPLMKAWHFHQANKAKEDINLSSYTSGKSMPTDREMIRLKNGVCLCAQGTVWTKKDGFGLFGGERIRLGSAVAMKGDRGEEVQEREVVSERELKPVAYDGLRPLAW